jgi:hypothetical protein
MSKFIDASYRHRLTCLVNLLFFSDLAKNGLGSSTGIPRVSSPRLLKEEPLEMIHHDLHSVSEDRDTDSEVDIN